MSLCISIIVALAMRPSPLHIAVEYFLISISLLFLFGIIYFELVINGVFVGLYHTQNYKEYTIDKFIFCLFYSIQCQNLHIRQ